MLSLSEDELRKEEFHVTGYPGDKGFKQMWTMEKRLDHIRAETFYYKIDTMGGQSGGAVWINKFEVPLLAGVHTTGSTGGNMGVRLSKQKFKDIILWMSATGDIKRKIVTVSAASGSSPAVTPPTRAASAGTSIKAFVLAKLRKKENPPASAGPASSAPSAIARPLSDIVIPEIARGYEEVYRRFVNGRLIYKPDPKSDEGRIELPIAVLDNPLDGVFDLSRCGNTGKYLSIATGYRTRRKAENMGKVEIWFVPRFFIERNLHRNAEYFWPIMAKWDADAAPVGIFWTLGGEYSSGRYDYLTSQSLDELSDYNLYDKYTINDREGTPPSSLLGLDIRSTHIHFSCSI